MNHLTKEAIRKEKWRVWHNEHRRKKRAAATQIRTAERRLAIAKKTSKICCACEDDKALVDYCNDKKAADGKQSRCRVCTRDYSKKWAQENPARLKELNRRLAQKNKESTRIKTRANAEKNRPKYAAFARKYRSNLSSEKRLEILAARKLFYIKNKQSLAAKKAAYTKLNPWQNRAQATRRKAAKKRRTPPWVDHKAINAVYKACPKNLTVDHIVPLQGKNVCGLHVHWNLQYLTLSENSSKGNRF